MRDYLRLKAALDRLQSTSIGHVAATSVGAAACIALQLDQEWKECADAQGRPEGIELVLPDWFYEGIREASLALTIDPAYFTLTGGIERWLYRLVRKHAGNARGGNSIFGTCM